MFLLESVRLPWRSLATVVALASALGNFCLILQAIGYESIKGSKLTKPGFLAVGGVFVGTCWSLMQHSLCIHSICMFVIIDFAGAFACTRGDGSSSSYEKRYHEK